jgi:hypothetical protein
MFWDLFQCYPPHPPRSIAHPCFIQVCSKTYFNVIPRTLPDLLHTLASYKYVLRPISMLSPHPPRSIAHPYIIQVCCKTHFNVYPPPRNTYTFAFLQNLYKHARRPSITSPPNLFSLTISGNQYRLWPPHAICLHSLMTCFLYRQTRIGTKDFNYIHMKGCTDNFSPSKAINVYVRDCSRIAQCWNRG